MDSAVYYGTELILQIGGASLLGYSINWFFNQPVHAVSHRNVFKMAVEVIVQISVVAAVTLAYFRWLGTRGWDPLTTPLGTAPFWIFMLHTQNRMIAKLSAVGDYLGNNIAGIDQNLTDEIEKNLEDVRKMTSIV